MAAILIAIPAFYGLYNADSIYERASYTIILIIVATTGLGPFLHSYQRDFQQKFETVQVGLSIMEV